MTGDSGDKTDVSDDPQHYKRAWRRMRILGMLLLFVCLGLSVYATIVATDPETRQLLYVVEFGIGLIISGFYFASRCPRCGQLFFFGPDWQISCTQLRCMNCGLSRRVVSAAVLLLLIAPTLSTCLAIGDRGYRMEPVGMEKVGKGQWARKFDGFEVQTMTIRGLVGEWWLDPDISISTDSQPVTVENIELKTPKGVYPATMSGGPKLIPALSSHEMLPISWRFNEDTPAPEILGESSRIVLHLRMGKEAKTVEITYREAKCC